MKQQITWEETKCDSVNGYGIKIHYLYTSFNKDEIDELKEWCMEHLNSGVVVKDQMPDDVIGKAESENKE